MALNERDVGGGVHIKQTPRGKDGPCRKVQQNDHMLSWPVFNHLSLVVGKVLILISCYFTPRLIKRE